MFNNPQTPKMEIKRLNHEKNKVYFTTNKLYCTAYGDLDIKKDKIVFHPFVCGYLLPRITIHKDGAVKIQQDTPKQYWYEALHDMCRTLDCAKAEGLIDYTSPFSQNGTLASNFYDAFLH